MKIASHLFYLSLGLTFLTLSLACGSGASTPKDTKKEQALLKQAADIHNEAINIGLKVAPQLEAMKQRRNQINIQGRALTEEEIQFVGKIDQLESSHRFWLEHLIEVPGFGHDHHHGHDHSGHDHDHDHGQTNQPALSADQMLAAQKEIRDSIVMIQQKVNALEVFKK